MKFYITTPIYYVNAKPHIGHAYTTLAADIMARWRKMSGDDVLFLTGTDEHGGKVEEAAKKSNKTPKAFTDHISSQFKKAWSNLGIEYSDFIRTTEGRHKKGVAAFLEVLKKNNALYQGEYKGLYCVGCENFITEKELVDGKCPLHKEPPQAVVENNWFFKLSSYLEAIRELIEADKLLIRPDFAKKEALGLIKQGLDDFSVTREKVKWGIKLPWDETQTVYVWVDALQNYITGAGYPDLNEFWPANVHLVGKDILKFHAIYWPAMLLAAGLEPPREIFTHGYFTIDGQKMSKSLGNVIDPNDLVKEFGTDGARHLIISQFPFGQDGDVKAERFSEQYNSDLANGLGNLVSRVLSIVAKNSEIFLEKTEENHAADTWKRVAAAYERFELEEVLKAVWLLIHDCDKKVEQEKLWALPKKDAARAGALFYELLETIRHISWLIRPFLPATSDKIFANLGLPEESKKNLEQAREWGGLPANTAIEKAEPLFPRK